MRGLMVKKRLEQRSLLWHFLDKASSHRVGARTKAARAAGVSSLLMCLALFAAPASHGQTCSGLGIWSGTYTGQTTDKDGNPKTLSGGVEIRFSQTNFVGGASRFSVVVSAGGYTVDVPGTGGNGEDTLGPVEVANATAGAAGAIASSIVTSFHNLKVACTNFGGSFYVNRNRPINGTFTVTKQVQWHPGFYMRTPSAATLGVRG